MSEAELGALFGGDFRAAAGAGEGVTKGAFEAGAVWARGFGIA